MIINDTHRFAFVHIPKCAGSTVRIALENFDETTGRYFGRGVQEHPVLGPLDYHHLPLAVLEAHFAQDFDRLARYRSYALVRDPFSRFPSSLHERLIQRDRRPLSLRDASEVAREIDVVLNRLAQHAGDTPITEPGLIHFSRQTDYVFLGDRQVVRCPRTVAEVDAVLEEISGLVGATIRSREVANSRLGYAFPAVRRLQLAVTGPIETVLPRWFWKPAYTPIKWALRASGLVRPAKSPLSELPNAPEIAAFIEEFYASDIALFGRLEADRLARAARHGT